LRSFRCYLRKGNDTTDLIPLSIESARASHTYTAPNVDIAGPIDDKLNKDWHVWGRVGEAHQAIFLLESALIIARDDCLAVELHHHEVGEAINLGRFRLSVSSDPTALEWLENRTTVEKITNPWGKLAAAYYVMGDAPAIQGLLEHHAEAEAGLGDLYAACRDRKRAISICGKLISSETPAVARLAKRATACIATKQWTPAKTDWLRVIELIPDQLSSVFVLHQNAERWSEAAEFGPKRIEAKPDGLR